MRFDDAVYSLTRTKPLDFDPVDLALPSTRDQARVLNRQETSPGYLQRRKTPAANAAADKRSGGL